MSETGLRLALDPERSDRREGLRLEEDLCPLARRPGALEKKY